MRVSTSMRFGAAIAILGCVAYAEPSQPPVGDQGSPAAEAPPAEAPPAEAPPAEAPPAEAPPAEALGQPPVSGEALRRDPAGVQGLSPYRERLLGGDQAYLAQDYGAASEAYRAAVREQPDAPQGQLRLGRALHAQNDLRGAERAWQAAARFAAKQPAAKSKALMILADAAERARNFEGAAEAWQKYAQHARGLAPPVAHPKSARERLLRIGQWQQMVERYAPVRERIEQREKEGEERLRESAR